MNFCYYCGKELPIGSPVCPHCGRAVAGNQQPIMGQPVPHAPRADGGVKGKSIASVVLGGFSLEFGLVTMIYLLIQAFATLLILASKNSGEAGLISGFLFVYVFVFSVISLGLSIAGFCLGNSSLQKVPNYKLPKIGRTLSLIGVILSAASIVLGFFMMLISLI